MTYEVHLLRSNGIRLPQARILEGCDLVIGITNAELPDLVISKDGVSVAVVKEIKILRMQDTLTTARTTISFSGFEISEDGGMHYQSVWAIQDFS